MRRLTRQSSGSSARAIRSCASTGPIGTRSAREFFRWEFATAVAGAVLGVNPFDQPDVEAAKIVTRRSGRRSTRQTGNACRMTNRRCRRQASRRCSINCATGDYFALLAFIEMNQAHRNALEAIRGLVRDRRKVATTVGFGPRYLHSTGQAHKGGPNSGVFLRDHVRRCRGSAGARSALQLRHDQAAAGARRFRSAGVARPSRAAGASEGCRSRPSDLHAIVGSVEKGG